jgi:hypothetical protein
VERARRLDADRFRKQHEGLILSTQDLEIRHEMFNYLTVATQAQPLTPQQWAGADREAQGFTFGGIYPSWEVPTSQEEHVQDSANHSDEALRALHSGD